MLLSFLQAIANNKTAATPVLMVVLIIFIIKKFAVSFSGATSSSLKKKIFLNFTGTVATASLFQKLCGNLI